MSLSFIWGIFYDEFEANYPILPKPQWVIEGNYIYFYPTNIPNFMADNVVAEQTVQNAGQVDQQAAFKAELDRNMQMAFTGIMPREEVQAGAPVNEPGAQTETVNTPVEETAQQATTVNDPWNLFKEKFGLENQDAVLKEIEQYRSMKGSVEVDFEDEDSAHLFKAFQTGKKDEVYNFLHNQRQLDALLNKDVDKDSAAEIVKLGMQLKYKDLTPEEINYQFNKQFSIPAKPTKDVDEDDTEYQNRVAQWEDVVRDKTFELTIAAKQYKPELATAKKSLVLPKIEESVDEGYIQYKKMLEAEAQADKVTEEAYKAFTPQQLETKINFKDEANKIDFDFQYVPNQEDFGKSVTMVTDFNQFLNSFVNPDGTPDRQGFLKAIYIAKNSETVIKEAMNQAKNATIKAMLPDNNDPSRRHSPNMAEPSELDRNMRLALQGYLK